MWGIYEMRRHLQQFSAPPLSGYLLFLPLEATVSYWWSW